MIRWLIALAILAGLASPVAAALPTSGVWQGSVGALPIRACFVDKGEFGVYFYLSKLKAIPLDAADIADGHYYEGPGDGKGAPRWTVTRADAATIDGSWTSGARSLPIRLTRVAQAKTDDAPCASLAFHASRLVGIRVVDTPAVKDGLHYTVRRLDLHGRFDSTGVQTIALAGSSPAIRRINRTLAAPLALGSGGQAASEWFECVIDPLAQRPNEGASDQEISVRMVTARYVTVLDRIEYYCGGPHPDSVDNPRLFDLRDGREIKLLEWLNGRAVKREPVDKDVLISFRPAFRQLLLAGWKPTEPECRETIETEDYWSVELTRTGLSFTPQLQHVDAGCVEEFPLPFARLTPYFNAAGKAGVAALYTRR